VAPQSLDDARRRKPAAKDPGGRVPPHNLEAEESLLGAMLLSPEAVESASGVEPGDFWAPAHGVIFAAITALAGKGEPCDPVTVADELRHQGTIELAGGAAALISLQGNTPAIGSAARYAHIVKEHAHARRLIRAFEKGQEASWDNDLRAASSALDEAAAIMTTVATEKGIVFEDVAAVVRGEVPPVVPTMFRRDDGRCLIYPGLLHWLMGEHGKGKTMCALHIVAEILGQPVQSALFDGPADAVSPPAVMYLDWEGTRRIVGSRLKDQGVAAEAVESRLLYYRPPALSKMITQHLWKTVVERGVVLVVCDGVAKALARQGWDEDRAGEVLAWLEILVAPLTEAGAAVLCLDHVAKDSDKRGLWARGSGAKMGEASVAWVVRPRESFSRHKKGWFELVQAKDREGMVAADGEVAAAVYVEPFNGGDRLAITVRAPSSPQARQDRDEACMQAISEELELTNFPLTKRALRSVIKRGNRTVDAAISDLEAGEFIRRDKEGYVSVRPFQATTTDAEEPAEPEDEEGSWNF
jgi:hypothetical protein